MPPPHPRTNTNADETPSHRLKKGSLINSRTGFTPLSSAIMAKHKRRMTECVEHKARGSRFTGAHNSTCQIYSFSPVRCTIRRVSLAHRARAHTQQTSHTARERAREREHARARAHSDTATQAAQTRNKQGPNEQGTDNDRTRTTEREREGEDKEARERREESKV